MREAKKCYGVSPIVVGLDMSLTGAAGVALPAGWDGTPAGVTSVLTGYKLTADATYEARIDRIVHVVDVLCSFIEKLSDENKLAVFIEDYAYSKHSASTTKLAEVGGAVRYFLAHELGIIPHVITASRARKYLLGALPKGKGVQKPAVEKALRSAGFMFESGDEYDGCCCANAGLAELGFAGITMATGNLPS